jgi:Fic family protein
MNRGIQGNYVKTIPVGEAVEAFLPKPLPPEPPIVWTQDLHEKFEKAHRALGALDTASTLIQNISMFQYMYVRQEAILSSMIEGTQSSLSDILLYELVEEPGVPFDDVREVSNYVAAIEYGLRRLGEGFPLCSRLFREIHEVLLSKGRGEHQTPGEFRRSQNWIGGSRPGNAAFVPPPCEQVAECMGKLDKFINDQTGQTKGLLVAALSHVQFETIHPFLDGNGRLGRLLITLLLCHFKILEAPMLYLSLYFKNNRQKYYELLNQVRFTGNWEEWLEFFADAVYDTATRAVEISKELHAVAMEDRERIITLGRAAASALKVHREILERPIATSASLTKKTGLTTVTVNRSLDHLEKIGIVKELTSKKRNRIFSYFNLLKIYNQNIEI